MPSGMPWNMGYEDLVSVYADARRWEPAGVSFA